MKTMNLILFGFLILAMTSCGPRVQTINPMDTDLNNYQTFAYLPNSSPKVEGNSYDDEQVNSMIIETVNQNMKQVGFNLDRDNPDLLVLISTKTEIERGTTTDPIYSAYPYSAGVSTVSPYYGSYYYRGYQTYGGGVVGYDTDTYAYEEGTVVIDLIDRETKETVWKGVTSEGLYNQGNTAAMRDLVNEIFQEYPMNKN